MWHGVSVLTRPDAELVSLDTLKRWLTVEHDEDDDLFGQMLRGAISRIDGPQGIGVAMMRQTWRKSLDRFRSCILLPGAPVKAIDKITYLDPAGVEKTLPAETYRLDVDSEPARLTVAIGKSWPATASVTGAVKVDYILGADEQDDVPGDLVDAVALIVAHRYRHREAVSDQRHEALPFGVDWILSEHARCRVSA